jgi:hypothetical protein
VTLHKLDYEAVKQAYQNLLIVDGQRRSSDSRANWEDSRLVGDEDDLFGDSRLLGEEDDGFSDSWFLREVDDRLGDNRLLGKVDNRLVDRGSGCHRDRFDKGGVGLRDDDVTGRDKGLA